MSKRSRRRWFRSPAVLIVAFVIVLGASGLVYAHWMATLTTEGNVNTGSVGVGWYNMGTDDDGMVDNDGSGTDDSIGEVFDMNGSQSSADPSSYGPGSVSRYDKDVGQCHADGGGDYLNVWIDNAYPSYHCTVYASVRNEGSVPVKAAGINLTVHKTWCDEPGLFFTDEQMTNSYGGTVGWDEQGPFADSNGNNQRDAGEVQLWETCTEYSKNVTNFLVYGGVEQPFGIASYPNGPIEVTADIAQGIRCGTQLDPWIDEGQGEFFETAGWIHVEQAASQNAGYNWTLEQQFVNWNEWDASLCTFGSIVADANGNPIGIANGTDTPDSL